MSVGMLFLISCNIYSQDTLQDEQDIFIQDKLESISNQSDNAIDYAMVMDNLNFYKLHKIDLNSAQRRDLERLGLLNDIQISSLLEHIRKNGKLLDIVELQTIDGYGLETIIRILPYVIINESYNNERFTIKNIIDNGSNSIYMLVSRTLETKAGYISPISQNQIDSSKKYLGSPYKLYTKYRFQYSDKISMGFTGEKDAGEDFFYRTNVVPKNSFQYYKGFDFYSAHVYYNGSGWLRTLIIGDYQLQFGQGLCLASGLTFSKTADVLSCRKNNASIMPYTSINENSYLRGMAATFGYKKLELTSFYSYHKLDANVTSMDSLTQEASVFSSFGTSGYHRTYKEMADKQTIGMRIFGGHVAYKTNSLNIGITGYHTLFDAAMIMNNLQPYNQYRFEGRMNDNYGFDYSYFYRNFSFFGEEARSGNGGMAYLNGVLVSLDSRTTVSILHRHYQKEYQALMSNGFGESAGTNNEEGIYMGVSMNLNKYWSIAGYYDEFTFPWLKYRVNAPSAGHEYLAQLTYMPNKKLLVKFRAKQSWKQLDNMGNTSPVDYLSNIKQLDYRMQMHYAVSSYLILNERIEYVKYALENQQPYYGMLIQQDVKYKIPKTNLTMDLRYAIFDCDSYYSRIYSYEQDVPNSFSIPAYYYKGMRYYLLMHYRINKNVSAWIRYSKLIYANRQTISSGLEMINGNAKTDLAAELKFSF